MAALRARRGPTALLFLLAVLAVAAGSAAPLYAEAAADRVRRQLYAEATGPERAISAIGPMPVAPGADPVGALRTELAGIVAGHGLTALTTTQVEGVTVSHGDPARFALTARDEVCAHLVVAGRCPGAAGEALVSAVAAPTLAVRAGSSLRVRLRTVPRVVSLTVVGLYRPTDPAEAYWAGWTGFTADGRREATPVFVAPETIRAVGAEFVGARVDLVALDPLRVRGDPAALEAAVAAAREAAPSGVTVSSALPVLR